MKTQMKQKDLEEICVKILNLDRKLRFIQADMVKKSQATVSMSSVIDGLLRKGLK